MASVAFVSQRSAYAPDCVLLRVLNVSVNALAVRFASLVSMTAPDGTLSVYCLPGSRLTLMSSFMAVCELLLAVTAVPLSVMATDGLVFTVALYSSVMTLTSSATTSSPSAIEHERMNMLSDCCPVCELSVLSLSSLPPHEASMKSERHNMNSLLTDDITSCFIGICFVCVIIYYCLALPPNNQDVIMCYFGALLYTVSSV